MATVVVYVGDVVGNGVAVVEDVVLGGVVSVVVSGRVDARVVALGVVPVTKSHPNIHIKYASQCQHQCVTRDAMVTNSLNMLLIL